MRSRRGFGALVLAALCLLAGACTPSQGETPSPAPTTLPPMSPSPTENAIERQQRLDYAAAEKAYRTFRAEFRRVTRAGGAKQANATMTSTAGGPYLAEHLKVIRAYATVGGRQTGEEKIVFIRKEGHSDSRIALEACEDGRTLKSFDKSGENLGGGTFLLVTLTVRKSEGKWKVWSGTGRKVDSCRAE